MEFADDRWANAIAGHGRGIVRAVGFMPGLASSPFKVGQTTLDEKWRREPLMIPGEALFFAGVFRLGQRAALACELLGPADLDDRVVETSLLTGPDGSALVLVNHGYRPIQGLQVGLLLLHPVRTATSTEGVKVEIKPRPDGHEGVILDMPLEWTDIVLLPK